jgi:hypothetical protein
MELIEISTKLKEKLGEFTHFENQYSAYGAAFLLRILEETLIDYIQFSNNHFQDDPQIQINDLEVRSLGILNGLYNDFFPMAHTNVSLGSLRILNDVMLNDKIRELRMMLNELEHLQRRDMDLRYSIENSIEEISRISNP